MRTNFFWLALAVGLAQSAAAADDFKEIEVPPPPAYRKEGLIAIDIPSSAALKFGVDPATLSIGSDGVLRYVMVAYSASGSINAMYEGLRCATSEVKTYARSSALNHWTVATAPPWRALVKSPYTQHALALAEQGACDGRVLAANNVPSLVRLLNAPRTKREY